MTDDERSTLPEGVEELIGPYLGRQRWFAGSDEPAPGSLRVVTATVLWASDDGGHRLWGVIVETSDTRPAPEATSRAREATSSARYQVLIGERPGGESADFLSGREEAMLGAVGSCFYYDATVDPEMALRLLETVTGGAERAERVRPVTVEQSNTSLVYDDRIIVKVFRRLAEGPNPDVAVTNALARAGFAHVATPLASWESEGVDLAFAQEYLAGGSEGWALALTSLRDFYNGESDNPAEAGGDFAGEAARLGTMTAQMHLAMAGAFGVEPNRLRDGAYSALIDDVARRLDAAADLLGPNLLDRDLPGAAPAVIERLRAVSEPGPALRVHGDYHLGQVMRTDGGWYVLDFEGEPARPVAERVVPASTAKDVTGMLRSFHYASRFALRERSDTEMAGLERRARSWEDHNREAFLAGYRATAGIDALLPPGPGTVLAAYELDKALYELDYERSYRPDWMDIPADAVVRILAELT